MHKVFISFHHGNDQSYKEDLCRLNERHRIFIDRSIETNDIDPNLPNQTIRKIIRDTRLRDSTVTILLLGSETRYRKHVDWELKSSMIDGPYNKKSGILVIDLPSSGANQFITSHIDEKQVIYPDYSNWQGIGSATMLRKQFPSMPQRIIDNLANPNAAISVVPWLEVINHPSRLRWLIAATSHSRQTNTYDLSRPMRKKDYNPTTDFWDERV